MFLATTEVERKNTLTRRPSSHNKGSHTFWPVEFVTTHGKVVALVEPVGDWQFTYPLGCITME